MAIGLLSKIALATAGTMVLGTAVLYSEGAITICVKERAPKEHHIHLPFPALALHLGLKFADHRDWRRPSADVQQWLPVAKIAAKELDRCPDGVLVEVEKPGEKVTIAKSGNYLLIDVESSREEVHISFPLKTVAAFLEEIESTGVTV